LLAHEGVEEDVGVEIGEGLRAPCARRVRLRKLWRALDDGLVGGRAAPADARRSPRPDYGRHRSLLFVARAAATRSSSRRSKPRSPAAVRTTWSFPLSAQRRIVISPTRTSRAASPVRTGSLGSSSFTRRSEVLRS